LFVHPQDDASDLEDDDLSNLDSSSETDGPTSNAQHVEDLKSLALKDPEFFKYLQENDPELLDVGGDGAVESEDEASEGEDSEGDSDEEMDDGEKKGKKGKGKEKEKVVKATPILTKEVLKGWQKSILEVCDDALS